MNVLEKILEEIEDHAIEFESFGMCDDYVSVGWQKHYPSHMGDVPKCRECSRRKFYMQGYEDGKKNDGWIPVSEKLPEENDGKYYPILNVSTSYGAVKRGFYRVRDKEWYIYSEMHGEFIKAEDKEVIAWQPLPKPYKEG